MSAGTDDGSADDAGPTPDDAESENATVHEDDAGERFIGIAERDGVTVVTFVDGDPSRGDIRSAQEECRLQIEEERR